MQVFSFGGGVQSVACLALSAQGELPYRRFLFANVGVKAENPATLRYLEEVAKPYAEAHGLEIIEISARDRHGNARDLYLATTAPNRRGIPIPVYMARSGAPGRRSCTMDYKRKPIARWLKQHGASADAPAHLGLGISLDEFQRMRNDSGFSHVVHEYPLIDRRMSRNDCHRVISAAGLPTPPKSSCWFCPFHSLHQWRALATETPELFAEAVQLEHTINETRALLGRDAVTLCYTGKPLSASVTDAQMALWGESAQCDGGYCGL